MIPKIIHYCWFGGSTKPDEVINCIASWRKYCSDWKIVEWNESNFDVSAMEFMQGAYAAQKWAFVSDVARLMIVYQEGGVYMDTDVSLMEPIDDILNFDAFFAYDNIRSINTGRGFGAVKGHPYVKEMINCYQGKNYKLDRLPPCPVLNTEALKRSNPNMVFNGQKTQKIGNCLYISYEDYNKYARHLGLGSWITGEKNQKRYRSQQSLKIQRCLQKYKYMSFIEMHFGENAVNIYMFLVYDFFDCGVWYFIRRFRSKVKRKIFHQKEENDT